MEGRALEHVLAGHNKLFIRMYDEENQKWVKVTTTVAKNALRYMRGRCKKLLEELEERGLSCKGGDKAVKVGGTNMSVDLYLYCKARGGYALVEVKWTRESFKACVRRAKACIPKLKAAANGGKWLSNRREVAASIVGALAVNHETWALELQAAKGRWKDSHEPGAPLPEPVQKSRNGSRLSGWKKWRAGVSPGDKPLWPSGKPGTRAKRSR